MPIPLINIPITQKQCDTVEIMEADFNISNNFRFDLEDQPENMEVLCFGLAKSEDNLYLVVDYLENTNLDVTNYFKNSDKEREACVVSFDYKDEMISTQSFKVKVLALCILTHYSVDVESNIGYRVMLQIIPMENKMTDDGLFPGKAEVSKMGNSQDGNPNTPDIPVTGTNLDPYLTAGAGIIMAIGGSYLVPKGYVTVSALAQIVSAVVSLIAMGYLAYKGTTSSKVSSLAKTLDVPKAALTRHIVAMKRGN